MTKIKFVEGKHRGQSISGAVLELISPFKNGVVRAEGTPLGRPGVKSRIKVVSEKSYIPVPNDTPLSAGDLDVDFSVGQTIDFKNVVLEGDADGETEAETIARINERFEILDELTTGVAKGKLKGLIVAGAPGVGKSHGVEERLTKLNLMDLIAGKKAKFEVMKGTITPIMLHCKLFEYSGSDQILIFDDCDSVFFDGDALNMLKAALDTSKKRFISYNSDSRVLDREGVPIRFEFKGTVIFITNLKPENTRSEKIKAHLSALYDRVLSLDLTIDTPRDRFLRVKSMVLNSKMLEEYAFTTETKESIIEFLRHNVHRLKGGISLRTALNIADLIRMKPDGWEYLARNTLIRRG